MLNVSVNWYHHLGKQVGIVFTGCSPNSFPFPSSHTERLHFPPPFALRYVVWLDSGPMACKQAEMTLHHFPDMAIKLLCDPLSLTFSSVSYLYPPRVTLDASVSRWASIILCSWMEWNTSLHLNPTPSPNGLYINKIPSIVLSPWDFVYLFSVTVASVTF